MKDQVKKMNQKMNRREQVNLLSLKISIIM
jgi:hypothetical protein